MQSKMKHQNQAIMSNRKQSKSVDRQVCLYLSVAILLLISGCANSAVLLDTNHLTGGEIRNTTAVQQRFNTLRFEAGGGSGENQIGYILVKDGIQVRTGGYVRKEANMTLIEALADYERYVRAVNASIRSGASIYEIINEGAVVGYIVISERMDFALWRDTSLKDSSGIVFILNYTDNYDAD